MRSASEPIISSTIRSGLSRNPTLHAGMSDSARASGIAGEYRSDEHKAGESHIEDPIDLRIPDDESEQEEHVGVSVDHGIKNAPNL